MVLGTVHRPWKKFVRKIIFFKFFLIFKITILQTICMPNFVKMGQFLIFRQFRALCTSKIKNCPILTKFGVHIVWSMVIGEIKKKFEKIYFSDNFFSWTVHCARVSLNIFIFFFILKKYLHVRNLKKIGGYTGYVHFA